MKHFFYVTQYNEKTKKETLFGYNLSESEKNKLFYSLGADKKSSIGRKISGDAHLYNGYGGHKKKLKNVQEAQSELMDKPKAFNDALKLINKAGYNVVKKGIVGKSQKVISYQMEKKEIFG